MRFRLTRIFHLTSLQTILKAKCSVGVQFARSIVNGLVDIRISTVAIVGCITWNRLPVFIRNKTHRKSGV